MQQHQKLCKWLLFSQQLQIFANTYIRLGLIFELFLSYFENFASIFDAMMDANKKKGCITLNPLFLFSASRFYEMFDIGSNSNWLFMNISKFFVDIWKGIWKYKECKICTYVHEKWIAVALVLFDTDTIRYGMHPFVINCNFAKRGRCELEWPRMWRITKFS